jgi:hypothetical protein|tara:strand:+ start:409 stop:1191 length:783 start_codon:yes stop_codon:yes gene_type:complete
MKSIYVTGSGQCGETFVFNLFKNNKKILAFDESRPLISSYYKFIKYNKLNIDDEPLFKTIENDIKKISQKKKIRLESSSFLSLHAADISKKFGSKIIILLRNPFDVANSLVKKGWYKDKYFKKDKKKIIGYQGVSTHLYNKHHNFCRLSPKGNYFYSWNKLDPLLKVKWYWDTIYTEIFKDLKKIPQKNYKIIKIEELDYKKYIELSKWIGITPELNRFIFNLKVKLVKRKNNKRNKIEVKKFTKLKSKIEKLYYKENLF